MDGMTCGHCVGTVQKALEGVGGVRRAEVDLASGVARVDADADLPLAALVAAVEAVGFGAAAASPERATTTLAVRGMTCARCEAWVADALRAVPGVARVAVSVADVIAATRSAVSPCLSRSRLYVASSGQPPLSIWRWRTSSPHRQPPSWVCPCGECGRRYRMNRSRR